MGMQSTYRGRTFTVQQGITVAGALLAGSTLLGCDRVQPCFEGRLEITVHERLSVQGQCPFEAWPSGEIYQIDATAKHDDGGACEAQNAEFVAIPADGTAMKTISGTGAPRPGRRVTFGPFVSFELGACVLAVGTELFIDEKYGDVSEALAGQEAGDDEAFVLLVQYNGHQDCSELFEGGSEPSDWLCGNTYRATVSKP